MCVGRGGVCGPSHPHSELTAQQSSRMQGQDQAGVTSVEEREGRRLTAPGGQTFWSNQNLSRRQRDGRDVQRATNDQPALSQPFLHLLHPNQSR